jgi:hypothetical protein
MYCVLALVNCLFTNLGQALYDMHEEINHGSQNVLGVLTWIGGY